MKRILGYADRFSVRSGEPIEFMVSSPLEDDLDVSFVRIVHGDLNPAGPGYKEEPLESGVSGTYPSQLQRLHPGSGVVVRDSAALAGLSGFHIQAMIWPTLPNRGEQALIAKWSDDHGGLMMMIDENGALALRLGDGRDVATVSTGTALDTRAWYRVDAWFDASKGTAAVQHCRLTDFPLTPVVARREERVAVTPRLDNIAPLSMGACFADADHPVARLAYDGKIDAPRLLRRPLSESESLALAAASTRHLSATNLASPIASFVADIVGAWDFADGIETTRVRDSSQNRHDGETHNMPTRAVKGHNWTGDEMNWRQAPEQYAAIHFHHDDLYDAGWQPTFTLEVPSDWRSGFYAARIRGGAQEEYIPFFVVPRRGKATSRLAFLVPTASYMAYANEHLFMSGESAHALGRLVVFDERDVFTNEHREVGLSLYDYHADGSGVCYSSRLRPIVNMRPKYQFAGGLMGSNLHQYNGDTHIVNWLEAMDHDYDVITDEDLHEGGMDLLSQYRVVMTGTHPEYYSTAMLDGLRAFTHQGGRLMYMGGNGFYWRIAYHKDKPGIIEVRRAEGGVRSWIAEAGEYYHSFTGEYGGMWLRQGRPPQALCGVGFTSQGFDISAPYHRLPDSFDDRAAFIFKGVDDDGLIGDSGLLGGAAGGFELDRADPKHGTPPNALIVATTMGRHTDTYLLVPEELHYTAANVSGTTSPMVRADMVFYETMGGGAVFSTGSIAFAGALSPGDYKNNASRVIDNVLKRFLDEALFETD
jgi:N,N-dimethylformamidase